MVALGAAISLVPWAWLAVVCAFGYCWHARRISYPNDPTQTWIDRIVQMLVGLGAAATRVLHGFASYVVLFALFAIMLCWVIQTIGWLERQKRANEENRRRFKEAMRDAGIE